MKSVLIGVVRALLLAWYRLCCLLPTRQRIVCLSRQQDSEPLDFQLVRSYMEREHPGWEVVILAKTMGPNLFAYGFHMLKQLRLAATSRAVLLDSYAIAISLLAGHIKVPVVQMWHAMGNMKRFGYTSLGTTGESRSPESARLFNMHRGYTSVLISSMSFADDYAAGFGCDPGIIYEAPLPKTDLLLDEENRQRQRQAVLEAYPQLEGKKVIVYAPTFRRKDPSNMEQAMRALVEAVDFERYALLFQPHPVSTQRMGDRRVVENRNPQLNPLFAADYVISDYSTVIYEAGLLGLPVFLYAYDWEEYQDRRSLNIDIEHEVPTLFTADPRQIMAAIDAGSFDAEAYGRFIANNVALPASGSCTQRVVDHLLALIEAAR